MFLVQLQLTQVVCSSTKFKFYLQEKSTPSNLVHIEDYVLESFRRPVDFLSCKDDCVSGPCRRVDFLENNETIMLTAHNWQK